MGRYGNGNGAYDQAMYDQLWNEIEYFLRDLRTAGRLRIHDPRPQITMGTHTHTTVQTLAGMSNNNTTTYQKCYYSNYLFLKRCEMAKTLIMVTCTDF